MLDILKSLLNLNRARCYKVRYIATGWQYCVLKSLKLVTLSGLQEESQVYVFHLLVELRSGFSHFHRFFELHLVFSSCRVQDLEAIQCAGYSARLWTLHWMGSRKMSAGFTNKTSITNCTRQLINHTGAKPLRDSIFYIKKILDFESSKDKPYINRFT